MEMELNVCLLDRFQNAKSPILNIMSKNDISQSTIIATVNHDSSKSLTQLRPNGPKKVLFKTKGIIKKNNSSKCVVIKEAKPKKSVQTKHVYHSNFLNNFNHDEEK
jgi:hypothetical protein